MEKIEFLHEIGSKIDVQKSPQDENERVNFCAHTHTCFGDNIHLF